MSPIDSVHACGARVAHMWSLSREVKFVPNALSGLIYLNQLSTYSSMHFYVIISMWDYISINFCVSDVKSGEALDRSIAMDLIVAHQFSLSEGGTWRNMIEGRFFL